MNTIIKTTGEKLKELRGKKLTQADLSEKTGISIQSIRAYETNKTIPENKNAKKLATFYNITVESLLNDNMDIVFLDNIQQTNYSKELGLSNKSIENIKKMTSELNVFLENDFCIKFVSKVNLLINIKKHLYNDVNHVCVLIEDYENLNLEEIEEALNTIYNCWEKNAELKNYIYFYDYYEKIIIDVSTLKDYNFINKDFEYYYNDLKTNTNHLLNEIIRLYKILKFEISEDMSNFLNNITN